MRTAAPLPPGSTIGILGGGQLGRMTALAAASLGYRCHIFCPERDSPAAEVSARATSAPYDDAQALEDFAKAVEVVTYEFENVPHAAAAFLAERVPVRPDPAVLAVCQHRLREKDFCKSLGIGTAPYAAVGARGALEAALEKIGRPAVLKTATLGYDGKGQAPIGPDSDLDAAWRKLSPDGAPRDCVLEGFVDFEKELAITVARDTAGDIEVFELTETRHRDHILHLAIAPAEVGQLVPMHAKDIACRLAEAFELVGLLAVEMFVTREGALLVNELAPRPHNSAHWTTDVCVTSQFEQLVRAIAGLPLGSTLRDADAVMENLLGDEVTRWPEILAQPNAKLHLYGKAEARPGRKMGHVTWRFPKGSKPKGPS
ncbi:MAG: 5-(carboxyamino)imidazole ribonucleotide synthase [Kiloniellales bacterium]